MSCYMLRSSARKTTSVPTPSVPTPSVSAPSVWVSATATRNWMIKDPLLDWLQNESRTLVSKHPSYESHVVRATVDHDALPDAPIDNSFAKFLMQQGIAFESSIIKHIRNIFGASAIADVGGNRSNALNKATYHETVNAMKCGVPIIYSGVLHDYVHSTYGIPDLLVRSDYINRIVTTPAISEEDVHVGTTSLYHGYHYRVIDIKFFTLDMKCDGRHLKDSGNYPAFKAQVCVYNTALAQAQGYDPKVAYLLGRRWKATMNGKEVRGDSALDKLGVVDFRQDVERSDYGYIPEVQKAIEWIRHVREHGKEWSPLNMNIPELFPNMSNTSDYPWRPVKEQIAKEIDEITMIWMCGAKNRHIAHSNGVYKWSDERCNARVCGVNGLFVGRVVNEILNINRPSVQPGTVLPMFIKNNDRGWQRRSGLELYVDFETVSDVVTDFSTIPHIECSNIISMIGVGYMKGNTKWIFKTFSSNALTTSEELRICLEFIEYVSTLSKRYRTKNPMMVHWGHAEQSSWNTMCARHHLSMAHAYMRWFDLCKVFKSEPIVIKGCMCFGLKNVAKEMHSAGLIKTIWDATSGIDDGASAMVALHRSKRPRMGIDAVHRVESTSLAEYNEVDCRVLQEIVEWLRENRCATRSKILHHVRGMDRNTALDYVSMFDVLTSGDVAYIERKLV
uniref:Uncharacterized protein n=1 Tax=viral metagenome TaxID=1070528 RepID=A0A6C0LXX4_9ZZZZ